MARFHLGPKMRKVVYFTGLFVLALVTFVFAVQATFPYDRVRGKIEALAGSKVDLKIENIERGIMPGVFYLEGVEMKTRPKQEDLDKAYAITDVKERDNALRALVTTIYVERMKIDIGLLAALGGTGSIDFNAVFGDGNIHGNITASKTNLELHIVGDEVPSELLPMREVLSNLPMRGNVTFELAFELPTEKLKSGKTGPNWPKAVGELDFECAAGCVIGDGKSRLKLKPKNVRQQAFAAEGTEFGHINVQSLTARAEIKDGKLDLTKFDAKSSDVELYVEYSLTLTQVLDDSPVMGCVRYKPTDALRKREIKTYDQILLIGGLRHNESGLDHIRLKGTFKDMKKLPELCTGGSDSGDPDAPSTGRSSRPKLTVQPDDPVKPATPSPTIPTPPAILDAGIVIPHHDAALVPSRDPTHEQTGSGSAGSGHAGSGSDATGAAAPPPQEHR